MRRLDVRLVELGLVPSRSKAQSMIDAGEVETEIRGEWVRATQASLDTEKFLDSQIRISANSQTLKYTSRGGLKLEAAILHLGLKLNSESVVLDVGISTGGFTDCLLQMGAGRVIGIDVGHGQLSPALARDSRLESFEGLHIRDLPARADLAARIRHMVSFCVVDVSFISLTHVLPHLAEVLQPGTGLLALVKPQFEVGLRKLEPSLYPDVREQVLHALKKCGFSLKEYFASPVKGSDGNQEFFVHAVRD